MAVIDTDVFEFVPYHTDYRDAYPLSTMIDEVRVDARDGNGREDYDYACGRADALEAFAAELAGRVMELEAEAVIHIVSVRSYGEDVGWPSVAFRTLSSAADYASKRPRADICSRPLRP